MSNKLVKPKSKQNQNSKTEINKNDPVFVKFLKNRLKVIGEQDKSKKRFKSSIAYLIIELFLLGICYAYFKSTEAIEIFEFYFLAANIIISLYNIIMSIYQICKNNYKKTGNIILIILHSIIILISTLILL